MNLPTAQQSEVHRRDDLRQSAMLDGNADVLSTLLHDDLIFIHAAGQSEDKTKHLAGIASRRIEYLKLDQSVHRSAPLGNDGHVINGRLKLEVRLGGNNIELDLVFVSVWVRNDDWQMISWQSTPWPK